MKVFNLILKRIIDILGSGIGIILLFPIYTLIGIAIKINSKGPAFFKQERLGKNGKTFEIIKFRTMVMNAENMGNGVIVNSESDDRITNVGSFLRKTSLDELPQLFNVIKGEMSLVGPRPPVTYHPYKGYGNYPDWAKKRFTMRPGVTGLTQVTVRNSVEWNDRIIVDNKYIDNFNIWFDFKILFQTLLRISKSEDIYLAKHNKQKDSKISD